jgi:hypothetical protein
VASGLFNTQIRCRLRDIYPYLLATNYFVK